MRPARSFINAVSSKSSNNSHSNLVFAGFHRVGYVKSAHGIRGELFLGLFAKKADWLEDVKDLALLKEGQTTLQILEISSLREHKDGLIAQLKGIADRNESELWRRAAVYVRQEALVAAQPGEIYLHQIEGFELADAAGVILGRIEGFGTNGPQDLLKVLVAANGRQALVPFVQAFIVDIDFDKKLVRMDLPPGLLDIES